MDYSEIRIRELKVFAHHGVYPKEKQEGQNFFVNAVLRQDVSRAGMQDKLELTTNYGVVCQFITRWMTEHTYKLIEAVAEQLSWAILSEFPLVREVELEIRKPEAPIPLSFESVSVAVKRGWHTAYLSVGSNQGDSAGYIRNALGALEARKHTKVLKRSEIIPTKPYGNVEQDDFLNAIIKIQTILNPEMLLEFLHEIEDENGRMREIHWGPRTLDLDIIFYDNEIYESEKLVIPHPDMQNREFVLKPMCEIAPDFIHPVSQKTMTQLLQELKS